MSTDHIFRQWINLKLVPALVEHNKLTSKQIIGVKSIDIRLQTANEVFALTFCYFVQINGITRDDNGDNVETFSIVVKVTENIQENCVRCRFVIFYTKLKLTVQEKCQF